MTELPVFSYRQGVSFVHRIPSWVKILSIPLFNIAMFTVDWRASLFFIPFFVILFFAVGFSLREQLRDLSPVFYYCSFLYLMNFIVLTCSLSAASFPSFPAGFSPVRFLGVLKASFLETALDPSTMKFSLRFCACVQSCAMMFGTSSSVQIREGIEKIEVFVRRLLPFGKEPMFSLAVSMLVVFIPTVFRIWSRLCLAYRARGGKPSLSMVLVLVPQLFSVGLRTAFETTKSIMNRM